MARNAAASDAGRTFLDEGFGLSTLSSTSTLAEIRAEYARCASYEEDGSVAKCRGFITACRLLLLRLPSRSARGGVSGGSDEVELNVILIREEMKMARVWLAGQAGGNGAGGTRFLGPDLDFKG